jgi:phosphoglycolate phosphatase
MINAAVGCARLFSQRDHRESEPQCTLYCDFDGPIVDVSDRYYHTYRLGLAEVEAAHQVQGLVSPVRYLNKAQFWQMKQERTPDVEIAMRSGLQGPQIEQFLTHVQKIVNQPALLHQDQLQPGVRWALALLKSQRVRLVLVTLRERTQALRMLQDHGLDSLFSAIWGAQDDHAAYLNQADHKTRLLKQAVAHEAFSCPHVWMVGDTEADVLAGQALKIPTLALTCGIRSKTYLQKFRPTRIQTDLLSAAHYLTGLLNAVA